MHDIKNATDQELVSLALKEQDAFGYIIARYEHKLALYVRRRAKVSHADIEDILQDIFIKVYTHLNDYNETLSFSAWVYRIAHNYVIDWYRKHKRDPVVSLDNEDVHILSVLPDESVDIYAYKQEEISSVQNLINQALAKILPDYREILILRFVEEKSYEEISDILKISKTSVGVKINRAKQALKKHINNINI